MDGAVCNDLKTEAGEKSSVFDKVRFNLGLLTLLRAHPWLTVSLMTLFCLFIEQKHKVVIDTTVNATGISGEIAYVKGIGAIAVAALCLMALYAFLSSTELKRSRKYLYMSTGVAVAFLLLRVAFALQDNWFYYVSLLFSALFIALFAYLEVNDVKASVFLACAVLCSLPVLGLSRYFYFSIALFSAVYLFYDNFGIGILRRAAVPVSVLSAAAVGYYLYTTGENLTTGIVYAVLVCCVGAFAVAAVTGKLSADFAVGLMLVAGFAIRLGYDLSIALPQNQHDVFPLNSDYPRHNSYIWHIFENLSLPTEKVYNAGLSQYYHPPLHHFVSALWMRFQTTLGFDPYVAYENVQYLTLFCSAAMVIAADKLFELFDMKGAVRLSLVAVIAFHPTMFIFAGSINNDPLATLLLFLAVLYTVRWYKEQTVANTLGLALTIGGAMLTKLSGAVVAIGTAYVMLCRLFERKNGFVANFKRLWKRFVLFGAVCFPLGLWWPIRCKLLFGMPLGYVPSMSTSNDQYLQGYSLIERITGIGSIDLGNVYPTIGRTLYDGTVGADYDYGILPYAVKSSLFGEYFWKTGVNPTQNILAQVMFYCAVVLIVISLAGLFCGLYATLLKGRDGRLSENGFLKACDKVPFRFLLIYFAALFGSYAMFCIKYPFTCTMDFRYIVPTLLIGAVGTGVLLRGKGEVKRWLRAVNCAVTVVFCTVASVFFILSY